MKKNLRFLLVVPHLNDNERSYDAAALKKAISDDHPDVVVLPEAFFRMESDETTLAAIRVDAIEVAKDLAEELGVAVLVGVRAWVREGWLECASYWNPKARPGESVEHFYAKHSTSEILPFELSDYRTERAALFEPIRLGGRNVGVLICHDQFFGRIPAQLALQGADLFVDLTGSDVVASKWKNVLAARSLDFDTTWLCTISRKADAASSNNRAFACAFRAGAALKPHRERDTKRGALVTFDSESAISPVKLAQAYYEAEKTDVSLTLAPSEAAADFKIDVDGVPGVPHNEWRLHGKCHVLVLDAETLRDPMAIHRHEKVGTETYNNIVCFVSRTVSLTIDEAIILARMRAIEHRAAIVVCTPSVREVVLASRYKNIQRVQERSGLFKFHGALLRGSFFALGASPGQGIPTRFHAAYAELAESRFVARKKTQSIHPSNSPRESEATPSLTGTIANALGRAFGQVERVLRRR